MQRLKFKKRTVTTKIVVLPIKATCYEEYYNRLRRKGELDTGCHFYIDEFGEIKRERDLEVVAGWHYEDGDTSIYILLEVNDGKVSSSQKFAVAEVIDVIRKIYPDIKVERRYGR